MPNIKRKSRGPRLLAPVVAIASAALLHVPSLAAGPAKVEIDWSGEYRTRAELRRDFDLDGTTDDGREPVLQRVRLGALARVDQHVEMYLQLQDSRIFGDEASTTSNEANVDLHQGWARLHPSPSVALTLGRQEWSYGDQRLIGSVGWDNVGRSFDGLRVDGKFKGGVIDGFWGRVARFVAPGTSEVTRDLFGAYGHFELGGKSVVEPHFLATRDGDASASEIEDRAGKSHVLALGGRLVGDLGGGAVKAEVVWERGEVGGDDLAAVAVAGSAAYRFGKDHFWIEPIAGFDFASGDKDPTDGKREEFYNFFPTNHMHYGYMDLFGWRNLLSPWGGVRVGGAGHAFQLKVHSFALDEDAGRWSSAGGTTLGSDPSGGSGHHVGTEIDLSWNKTLWQALGIQAGFGHFAPGRFAKATRGADEANFCWLEGTVKF